MDQTQEHKVEIEKMIRDHARMKKFGRNEYIFRGALFILVIQIILYIVSNYLGWSFFNNEISSGKLISNAIVGGIIGGGSWELAMINYRGNGIE